MGRRMEPHFRDITVRPKAQFATHALHCFGSNRCLPLAIAPLPSVRRGYGGNPADPATSTPLVYNRGIMWAYIVSGLVACSLVDTLYSQAGMDTPLNPREVGGCCGGVETLPRPLMPR